MARSAAAARPATLSPGRLLREGLDWMGRTGPASLAGVLVVLGGLWALRRFGPSLVEGWSRGHEALATLPLAFLTVPAMGHVLRRLNDMGWRGWWAWLLLVPWVRGAFLLLLVAMPTSQRRLRGDGGLRLLGMGLAGVAGIVLLASLVWTTAPVLAGGMKPALLPGDLALVRRAPLAVARGDVIAFRLDGEPAARTGRVIALGGERVSLTEGRPVIDGVAAQWAPDGYQAEVFAREGPLGVMPVCGNGAVGLGAECLTRRLIETLPGGASQAILDAGPRPLDAMAEVRVPEGVLFVLGDHRDAAQDSRLAVAARGTGLVAEAQVIGRIDRVLASSAAAWPWDPRGWRLGRIGKGVR